MDGSATIVSSLFLQKQVIFYPPLKKGAVTTNCFCSSDVDWFLLVIDGLAQIMVETNLKYTTQK